MTQATSQTPPTLNPISAHTLLSEKRTALSRVIDEGIRYSGIFERGLRQAWVDVAANSLAPADAKDVLQTVLERISKEPELAFIKNLVAYIKEKIAEAEVAGWKKTEIPQDGDKGVAVCQDLGAKRASKSLVDKVSKKAMALVVLGAPGGTSLIQQDFYMRGCLGVWKGKNKFAAAFCELAQAFKDAERNPEANPIEMAARFVELHEAIGTLSTDIANAVMSQMPETQDPEAVRAYLEKAVMTSDPKRIHRADFERRLYEHRAELEPTDGAVIIAKNQSVLQHEKEKRALKNRFAEDPFGCLALNIARGFPLEFSKRFVAAYKAIAEVNKARATLIEVEASHAPRLAGIATSA